MEEVDVHSVSILIVRVLHYCHEIRMLSNFLARTMFVEWTRCLF